MRIKASQFNFLGPSSAAQLPTAITPTVAYNFMNEPSETFDTNFSERPASEEFDLNVPEAATIYNTYLPVPDLNNNM